MAGLVGIQETKEVLVAVVAVHQAIKKSLADGKPDLWDIRHLFGLVGPIKDAIADGGQIPSELGDLQEGEYDELVEAIKPMIEDLSPDAIEEYIFTVLGFVKDALKLFKLIKE